MGRRIVSLLAVCAVAVALPAVAGGGKPPRARASTRRPALLTPLAAGSSVTPIISVGDVVGGVKFESILTASPCATGSTARSRLT